MISLDAQPSARYSFLEPNPAAMDNSHTVAPDPPPKSRHKRQLYIRTIAFILFESTFLIFAYYCLLHPIPLQSDPRDEFEVLSSFNVTLTELKAGITAVSVAWHGLACLFIKDIIAVVYSAEFMIQYRRFGGLDPGVSDRVSTITSGLLDNLVHFSRIPATGGFRLAFISMLLVMIVGPLGSGTITVGTVWTTMGKNIGVANITAESIHHQFGVGTITERARLITRMERLGNVTFGYDMNPRDMLIPWPNVDIEALPEHSSLVYQSDVLQIHSECAWEANVSYTISSSPDMIGIHLETSRGAKYDALLASDIVNIVFGINTLTASNGPDLDKNTTSFIFYNYFHPQSDLPPMKNLSFLGLPDMFKLSTKLNNSTIVLSSAILTFVENQDSLFDVKAC
ncbi:hypothetical protein D9756_009665 [Leucocoprinus leucothites]|uniref:Uncharacterized protein n=1 Tax=Leucocoprinus leucothites TaxID=201217 RepID=A0A8H5CUX7_9AGAR|nr:hypothetical protein D9756_009665 [Leucoagaricus leucothites]